MQYYVNSTLCIVVCIIMGRTIRRTNNDMTIPVSRP